ncbi:hypothetical protein GCM10025881_23920 [Pseudolysinimonas kribbensis]|uniref:Uncharacterized protein n=1 Tax=Pseudolysinimonas kribbensis TaxID=433641 RepID=A0ABQ6K7Q7_9MICO|nr:hypothetical protein GCM10025881_23920 [Pseudolysinimonas kribbensis]
MLDRRTEAVDVGHVGLAVLDARDVVGTLDAAGQIQGHHPRPMGGERPHRRRAEARGTPVTTATASSIRIGPFSAAERSAARA